MYEQLTCPCGYVVYNAYAWVWDRVKLLVSRRGTGYCINCGARLGFDSEGNPTVEPRVEGPAVGTFAWAVERMREGKRVRRHGWIKGACHAHDTVIPMFFNDFDATDWEVVE